MLSSINTPTATIRPTKVPLHKHKTNAATIVIHTEKVTTAKGYFPFLYKRKQSCKQQIKPTAKYTDNGIVLAKPAELTKFPFSVTPITPKYCKMEITA
jgi:hypothetical protein